ncbi:hypothetical protein [Amnibacterium endophyticum]|uniref:Uncharacterized protein n=1 Tax=Amnibacterium endophyticum TaxID=2109337 RepID=A0ABW4LI48_9MICO
MLFEVNLAADARGWADPTVQIGDAGLKMTASYLTDALGELLQALMSLVNGSLITECEWTQEPGGWRWEFRRPDEAAVDLVIAFKEDAYTQPWISIESAQVRLQERLPLTEVIEAITAGSRRCFEQWGLSGFAEQWDEHPFPLLQLKALERWLDDRVPAPLYA